MIRETTGLSVRRQVTVELPQERAYRLFTSEMGSWWPRESHHVGELQPADVVMEPRDGGRWFERDAAGTECEWGFVTSWDPPERVLLAWHLDLEFEFDPDPAMATQVEVRFVPEGPSTTRVELEHRGFEVFGERGKKLVESVGSEGGWAGLLELYVAAAAA